MKSDTICERLVNLRTQMKKNGFSAYLINGSDPHMSEYVPARWQTREYISGFSGSYGWLAITTNKAVLWTDTRYYLQANQQLEGTGITMMKARDPEELKLNQWLAGELNEGDIVAFDGACYSNNEFSIFEKSFSSKGIKINFNIDLLDNIWIDRPELPFSKAFLHPMKWAGQSRKEKFVTITNELEKVGADLIVISALDDLGWVFNLRGADVDCNPVALGFGIVEGNKAKLFIDPQKLNDLETKELLKDGVEIIDYYEFYSTIKQIKGKSIFIDPDRTNYKVAQLIKGNNKIIEGLSIPAILKSCKNKAEIEGMKLAHITDGIALLDFQLWLEKAINELEINEYDVALKLSECRAKRPGYVGDSFFPIIGYKDHGAIVHFHVESHTANELEREGVLLFDSGGQYEFGTTDVTRTIGLGAVSDQFKKDFTLVLKGMIKLSKIKFPKGTIGCHLDVLAREALWLENLNYGHGTGHGVGAFMNVHEGPGSIRQDLNDQPIRIGNIFSNEPAFYREGQYGLRTENVMVCVQDKCTEYGDFLRFETLTQYPIDTNLIEKSLLSEVEIDWINNYHQTVLETLSPLIDEKMLDLLKRLTQAI